MDRDVREGMRQLSDVGTQWERWESSVIATCASAANSECTTKTHRKSWCSVDLGRLRDTILQSKRGPSVITFTMRRTRSSHWGHIMKKQKLLMLVCSEHRMIIHPRFSHITDVNRKMVHVSKRHKIVEFHSRNLVKSLRAKAILAKPIFAYNLQHSWKLKSSLKSAPEGWEGVCLTEAKLKLTCTFRHPSRPLVSGHIAACNCLLYLGTYNIHSVQIYTYLQYIKHTIYINTKIKYMRQVNDSQVQNLRLVLSESLQCYSEPVQSNCGFLCDLLPLIVISDEMFSSRMNVVSHWLKAPHFSRAIWSFSKFLGPERLRAARTPYSTRAPWLLCLCSSNRPRIIC